VLLLLIDYQKEFWLDPDEKDNISGFPGISLLRHDESEKLHPGALSFPS